MDHDVLRRTEKYSRARKEHPAWLLLASTRGPLVLGCLVTLFDDSDDGIAEEVVLQSLTEMLSEFASDSQYDIDPRNTGLLANQELRQWIKRGFVIERGQRIYATDALNTAMQFVESLENRIMTSTASRLLVVQREIENLNVSLTPNPGLRKAAIKRKIQELESELERVDIGDIDVLSEETTIERIREIYALASGLRADFRRVEDSWREADRQLRQDIMSEGFHRGNIMDRLLDGQEELISTPEGRVFDAFQQQMRAPGQLEEMTHRLKSILSHPAAEKALNRAQINDLRWLRGRLVRESQPVLQARSRSEKDVKGFLKTGLTAEHHRVGALLTEIMSTALELDWSSNKVRKSAAPLPPIGFALGNIPVVERIRFQSLEDDSLRNLDFSEQTADISDIGEEFWEALQGLDREAVIRETLATLAKKQRPVTIAELAQACDPGHDLETLALWIGMAREAGIEILGSETEVVELIDEDATIWLFRIPQVAFEEKDFEGISWEL